MVKTPCKRVYRDWATRLYLKSFDHGSYEVGIRVLQGRSGIVEGIRSMVGIGWVYGALPRRFPWVPPAWRCRYL